MEGSYEEAPQGLIENAQRDRRWCQGNMQHGLVLFASGLRGISRLHLIQGIFGYLSGPLWLLFLLTFNWMWGFQKMSGLSDITVHSYWMSSFNLTGAEHAFLIFIICMTVLLLPKFLALVDIAMDRERSRDFGGLPRTVASTVGETIFSTLHAPLQMLWHSSFVFYDPSGKGSAVGIAKASGWTGRRGARPFGGTGGIRRRGWSGAGWSGGLTRGLSGGSRPFLRAWCWQFRSVFTQAGAVSARGPGRWVYF